MRSDWELSLCTGSERLRKDGKKLHPTQKPEALLYRVISSSTSPGDIILDPFFGTGTTGAVARRLHRHFIGIEKDETYARAARERIKAIHQVEFNPPIFTALDPRKQPRIPIGALLENNLLEPGQTLYFGEKAETSAMLLADGSLDYNGTIGSIHQVARSIRQTPINGWDAWYYKDRETGHLHPIDHLRNQIRRSAG
jgi:modification methylase